MNARPLFAVILLLLTTLITPMTAFAQSGSALTITSPNSGTVVNTGQTIIVTVEAATTMDKVLLSGPGIALVDTSAPYSFEMVIPLEAQGTIQLSATGRDSSNNFHFSEPISLLVDSTVILTGISVDQTSLVMTKANEQWALTVYGTFSNGSVIDISSANEGTTYASLNPAVATVSAEGLITSIASGTTEVQVRNGSLQASVEVVVDIVNQAPVAVAGEDITIAENGQVSLDASGSFDPDQGPNHLSYRWTQLSGPQVLDNQQARSAETSLPPLAKGIYVFELVVNDGELDSQPDTITIYAGELHRTFLSVIMTN